MDSKTQFKGSKPAVTHQGTGLAVPEAVLAGLIQIKAGVGVLER